MSVVKYSAIVAGKFTVFLVSGILLVSLLLNRLRGNKTSVDWQTLLFFAVLAGLVVFGLQFGVIYSRLHSYSRANAQLRETQPKQPELNKTGFFGLVAAEGGAFSSLRTFLIFATPEALYGWKAEETLFSPPGPDYFLLYAELLQEPELAHDLERIKGLALLKGGFELSRSRVKSVEFYPKRMWWLGGVKHAGRLTITLTSGCPRKFILLGNVDGTEIRARILSEVGAQPKDSA